jgi:hypothetical protein
MNDCLDRLRSRIDREYSPARLNVVAGETVLIRYLGRVEPEGGGEPYFNYRVAVDREEPKEIDWRAIAAEHGDDLDEIPAASPAIQAQSTAMTPPAAGAEPKVDPDDDIPF